MDFDVLYLDEHLVAVNKPSGLAVHPGWAAEKVTAMSLVRDRLGQRVYPVHRLDRATSGVLLFALTSDDARRIQSLFAERSVVKRYRALVRGVPPEQLDIDHPIPRSSKGPPKAGPVKRSGAMAPQGPPKAGPVQESRATAPKEGRVEARTRVRTLFAGSRYAWVEAIPETGRLHQVRRHLKHVSHPIIGDVRYGKGEHNRFFRSEYGLHRLALHALELALTHPITGAPLLLVAPLPPDLAVPLARWGLPQSAMAG